jgi:hypothetical protein
MGRVGRAIAYISLLLAGPVLAGCAAKPVSVDPPKGVQNLSRIATAYIDAEGRLGRPPKDVEELKPLLKDLGNPDEMLSSPNDGLPYTILWNVSVKNSRRNPVLAYEQKGKDGKRLVVDGRMMPWSVSDDQFERLRVAPADLPAPGK